MKGRLAELMSLIAPQIHRKYVMVENGQNVLYVKAKKALYCMLKSTLLFYKKVRADLESIGFKVNSYDPCIANKLINGNHMTMIWIVDNLKISRCDGWESQK